MAPIIGIPAVDSAAKYKFENYKNAIEQHGGVVRFLVQDEQSIEEFIAGIDGLLLPGGGDLDPKNFNQEWHPTLKHVNEDRDELELSIFKHAIEKDTPTIGICFGIQIMNVAMGGDIYQDIESEYPQQALTHPKVGGEDSLHEIEIEPCSLLSKLVGKSKDFVNSAHHQALDNIGEGFVVTARSSDGIVEAVEDPSKRFVVGVQYHPERMLETDEFREHRRKLFEAFIKAAAE